MLNIVNTWKKLSKSAHPQAETFLRQREPYCVSAISRFTTGLANHVWATTPTSPSASLRVICGPSWSSPDNALSGLLLYGKRLLFPVFAFSPTQTAEYQANGLPLPAFFPQILRSDSLHAAQGLAADMDLLEAALQKKGFTPSSSYNYELRSQTAPKIVTDTTLGDNLIIRKPTISDINALFPLQAGYEQEEVLPKGAEFEPAVCLKGLEYLIAQNTLLMAELEGRPVGKVNINAQSYNCLQIGGVYVRPEFRSLGIAQALTTALVQNFAAQKQHFTLFVKKTNIPARRVYDKLGFEKIGDYRISYYG